MCQGKHRLRRHHDVGKNVARNVASTTVKHTTPRYVYIRKKQKYVCTQHTCVYTYIYMHTHTHKHAHTHTHTHRLTRRLLKWRGGDVQRR
jgi:hypothetical protein